MSELFTIYTIQLASQKKAREQGIPVFDITVMSGYSAFAPTWPMVMGFKRGELSEQHYTEQYYDILRQTWHTHPEQWRTVLETPTLALGCYCPAAQFCHRLLLADVLVTVHHYYGREADHSGELLYT